MIFVTVGTQLPFDRLVGAMDEWAAQHPGIEVFGQIGPAAVKPRHFKSVDFLPPAEVDACFRRAECIVAHAGMGTILSALVLRRPLIIMPRRQALQEHRSDHQVTTARWLQEDLKLTVADETEELWRLLDARQTLCLGRELGNSASPRLLDTLRQFALVIDHDRETQSGWSLRWRGLRSAVCAACQESTATPSSRGPS